MLQTSVSSTVLVQVYNTHSKEQATFLVPLSSKKNWCWLVLTKVHQIIDLADFIRIITGLNRFPFNNFTYFLTLFSKFFSSFPHGTCSLSVSRPYLALDETYHPFWAAFPNNPTLWKKTVLHKTGSQRRDSHPLWYPIPRDLYHRLHRPIFLQLQFGEETSQILKLSSSRFTRRY